MFREPIRRASQVAQMVKNLPANAGDIRDMGLILGWEDALELGRTEATLHACTHGANTVSHLELPSPQLLLTANVSFRWSLQMPLTVTCKDYSVTKKLCTCE